MSSGYPYARPLMHIGVSEDQQPFSDTRFSVTALEEMENEQLYKILEDEKRKLSHIQLENVVLEDFLTKNDPKLLIGVTNALKYTQKTPRIHFAGVAGTREKEPDAFFKTRSCERGSFSGIGREDSSSIKTATSFSRRGGASVRTMESPRPATDYRINYSMKIEITDKLCDEIDQTMKSLETKVTADMRDLNASISEYKLSNDEVVQTEETFQKYVATHKIDISNRITSEKFIRYFEDWLKNGTAIVEKMRLRVSALKQQCFNQKIMLNKKADLSINLSPIDFELSQIERSGFMQRIEDNNKHLIALKKVTGNAALQLNQNQKALKSTEQYYEKLISDANGIEEHISRMEKERNKVQADISMLKVNIEKLKNDMENYVAPSTIQFVQKKHELSCLEKEKKYLKRHIYILSIKLSNDKIKWRKSIGSKEGNIPEEHSDDQN